MHRFAETPPVEMEVGRRLRATDETVAVAESFTGGLVGGLLTDVPGAGGYFDRGVVTYTYGAKMDELAVSREVLEELGAVNAIVAEQMARGIRDVAGTRWGVSTTGIAGPPTDGHENEPPVGTGFVGIAYRSAGDGDRSYVESTEYQFDGDRHEVRERGARQALEDLLDHLE